MATFNDPFFDHNMDDFFGQLMAQMNRDGQRQVVGNGHAEAPEGQAIPVATKAPKQASILTTMGRNLTQEAKDGLLDPVIGRDKEIQETAEVLSRRSKNNPILVGDAGVGKTAVVEGLAQAIVANKVPAAIAGKQIYSIDLANLEAGTQYRGAFEENIQALLKAVQEAGNVILFFDEIHQILGAGATGEGGSKGLADIIKPALSRGSVTVIGATTQDEYRNTIMKDAALARRFNDVMIGEPSAATTMKILQGLRQLYAQHHHVALPDAVLKACIDYSVQYLPQRSLPDKAIDLLDMTAAHLAAQHPVVDRETLARRIKSLTAQKAAAVKAEDFEKAAKLKQALTAAQNQTPDQADQPTTATPDDVAQAVERLTGIPVAQMGADDIARLQGLGERLKGKVIGQDQAVAMVARAIRRNRAGFDDGERPIGSFLFVGPTGVGKTELAKQLAQDMFGRKDALIRLDMSEYSDRTAVSKLIGTTAGYVGYDDNGNTLTEQVRRQPYAIVLLDEIEKADPQVLTLLLQVLDDGRLTDGQGNVVNFKNTIIIATSNAGFGNGKFTGTLKERLAPFFRPEFLNRFDGVVEFSALTRTDLNQIVELMLADVGRTLQKKGLTLTVSPEAKAWLIDQGYDEALGARPLRRVIAQHIRDRVTDYYLDHRDCKQLKAELAADEIQISAA